MLLDSYRGKYISLFREKVFDNWISSSYVPRSKANGDHIDTLVGGDFFSSPALHPLLMEATAAPAGPQSLTSAVLRRYLFSPDLGCRDGSGEDSDPALILPR